MQVERACSGCCLADIGVEAKGTGQRRTDPVVTTPNTSQSRAISMLHGPPCPPTASTHPNRNMYVFICRLRVHAGGVASLKTCPRAPGQLGALASTDRTANTNNPLVRLGASPDTQGASSDPAPQCIPYTGTPHVCAMRGWARKGPWGPEVGALGAGCLWVASKPLDRHGLSTPLELKLPQYPLYYTTYSLLK